MSDPFIDTDVIIRLLTGDDPAKQAQAAGLFEKIEAGSLKASAPDTVIADAVYVLSSPRLYGRARLDVREMLTALVRLPGFRVKNRRTVLEPGRRSRSARSVSGGARQPTYPSGSATCGEPVELEVFRCPAAVG